MSFVIYSEETNRITVLHLFHHICADVKLLDMQAMNLRRGVLTDGHRVCQKTLLFYCQHKTTVHIFSIKLATPMYI